MEVEQSPIEIVFQGGRHHSVQILATPVFIETQTPINSGSYQWLRLADGEYLPIKGATTRCYSPTADDLYTNIRLCYTTVDGLETVVNVPTDFFVMDPFVQTTVEQYVNQGRSEGITFEVTMVRSLTHIHKKNMSMSSFAPIITVIQAIFFKDRRSLNILSIEGS
eukprot:TRINITY_DN8927_c0_g1_i2.p1 TRINITY_DN8927_c0_g1~~TRINITY_DN8927_c0_g1_i2.p1  ORF type:complete len:165 (+),score=26.20 TRINITY_DN8927_c0_g1_i2:151-645(+)